MSKKATEVKVDWNIGVLSEHLSRKLVAVVLVIIVAIVAASSVGFTLLSSRMDGLRSELRIVQASSSAGKLNFRLEQKEWEGLYAKYNEDYFNGKLPAATVVSRELDPNICGQTSMQEPKHPKIEMNPLAILGSKHAHEVLLHEMIHVKLRKEQQVIRGGGIIWLGGFDDPHGPDFRQELHRLIGMGAFDDLLS